MSRTSILASLAFGLATFLSLTFVPIAQAQTTPKAKSAKRKQLVKALEEMRFNQLGSGTVIKINEKGLQGDLDYRSEGSGDRCILVTGGKSTLIVNERTLTLGTIVKVDGEWTGSGNNRLFMLPVQNHPSISSIQCQNNPSVGMMKEIFKNRIEVYLPEDQVGVREEKSAPAQKKQIQEILGNTGEASI